MSIEENPWVDIYNFCHESVCPTTTTVTTGNGDLLVTQAYHGFVFGNVLKCIATDIYALAKSDDPADAEVVGIVSQVLDSSHFFLRFIGNLDGFLGLIPATTYFLSDTVAGALTTTEPVSPSISKPLLIAHSPTAGIFFNFRGIEPGMPGGGGAMTVEVGATGDFADGETSVSDVSTITFNQDQFKVHDNTGGDVQVALKIGILPTFGVLTSTGADGITITSGTGAVAGAGTQISQQSANTSDSGYLSFTDWNIFNNKQDALIIGDLSYDGTDGITVTGGANAIIGAGVNIFQHVADATHNGYLSSEDWLLFSAGTTLDRTVTLFADGAGSTITSGTKNPIKVPFGGTLQGWTMMCKPSGSVTVDIFRAAGGAGLPVTSIIGGGTKPAIASDVENSSTSFSGWTSTTITAKDNLAIDVSGVTDATYCAITLYYK